MIKDLEKLGLTDSESKVYIAMMKLGGGYVSTIARKADVERTNCYHTLKTLVKKGFASITNMGNFKYFLPEDPKKLISEQKARLNVAERIVPDLLNLKDQFEGFAPKMKYFEGKKGVNTVLEMCLESQTEVLSYTNVGSLLNKMPEELKEYCNKKAERKIKTRMISPYEEGVDSFLEDFFPKEYIEKYIQLLYVNPKEFFLDNDVTIFDDKVSIVSLNPDDNIGVIIESKVFADSKRTIFNLSWLGATSFVAK